MSVHATPETHPPLDESLYERSGADLAFWMQQTRIEEAETLKRHVLDVQKKAYEVYGYPCIRIFDFMRINITRLPAYEHVIQLTRERPDALILDIGCFGHDTRKVAADGWPVSNIIASDLRKGFWEIGHELFRSSPKTFPVVFVEGDALSTEMIAPHAPFYEPPDTPRPILDLLTSLTPLQGHLSAIHASSLFHIFSEAEQRTLAHRLASLLARIRERGLRHEMRGTTKFEVFRFSPEDWKALWDEGCSRRARSRLRSR
ncbi:hypothetical protein BD779DRAFT_1608770 [Infundibulicybe gibba]|nr:hypothetical protein BD779DRAFT_1608770 [Infundibulicybe gibba]